LITTLLNRIAKFSRVRILCGLAIVLAAGESFGEPLDAVPYHPPAAPIDDPEGRCHLDLRVPKGQEGFATLVWFHGGGLTGGKRDFPEFTDKNVALVSAGYRLSPQVPFPGFIEDAAAATAWVLKNIASYGGDPAKVFVGGHSAGGYLASMVGMDPRWLAAHGLSHRAIAGIIPVSGQATTHFHVKELRGDKRNSLIPVIDEFAPLYYVSPDLPAVCLILGDRRIEFKSRVEENELLAVTLRNLGHPAVEFHELKDLDHGTVTKGAAEIMPKFIARTAATINEAAGQ
jgi:acetyl esterase/lipase